ncbi:hypothetical protein BJ165DRAFT_1413860 [Panaeolus papilionaceus]|nr:hypothetical protein BJ165DRAFT_1413860 [Panaeolus papilionaceus]
MAGTGKSSVIRALTHFFKERNEPYRFVLLGPTGTSAALIGGSTYHSFLGINTGSRANRPSVAAIADLRERLRGVSYLTPIKGGSLYSRDVTMYQHACQTIRDQNNTLGKSAWIQFSCVVILQKNMRQLGGLPDEIAFRGALENLRYYACTEEDIALLRSRIPSLNPSLSLDDPMFKNVSIITAFNWDKDSINDVCTAPKAIAPSLQKKLWKQSPSTSEQIAGCLQLCVGLPVLIRHNEATELCITWGQEAVVVGWTAVGIAGHTNHKRLDVLFVELINPPTKVQIAKLPPNVVPLTSVKQAIDAMLPSDEYLRISRSQIPVLPNFSITDYSSQGKSRGSNPGKLPLGIIGKTLWETIDAYRAWKKTTEEDDWHEAIREETEMDKATHLAVVNESGGNS